MPNDIGQNAVAPLRNDKSDAAPQQCLPCESHETEETKKLGIIFDIDGKSFL